MTVWRGQARTDVLDLVVHVLQRYTKNYGSYETALEAVEAFEASLDKGRMAFTPAPVIKAPGV